MDRKNAIIKLTNLFEQLKLKAQVASCQYENSFLIFDIALKPGGTFKKLENHTTEIALSLKALSEPLIYPVTKEGVIRMEVMVEEQRIVPFEYVIDSPDFLNNNAKLPLALGQCRNGETLVADLAEMPHLLISGSTGSGKSIMLHSIINSLLMAKHSVNLALIDPKRVEFSYYSKLLNLHGPIARSVDASIDALNKLIKEMEKRFQRLEKYGVRDINGLKGRMPFIVVIIDELADLMMASKKEVQELVCRLAQKSRACGIHLVIATQRPSVDVITGVIKANFPARISCQVSAAIDSRVVLDRNGAETLVGKGDAIIDCSEHKFKRFKGSFLTEKEIVANVNRKQNWWSRIWNS